MCSSKAKSQPQPDSVFPGLDSSGEERGRGLSSAFCNSKLAVVLQGNIINVCSELVI